MRTRKQTAKLLSEKFQKHLNKDVELCDELALLIIQIMEQSLVDYEWKADRENGC